ncbi:MAG TPA: aldo/keto reductase [Gemmataceae bacterium]|nr:aldo/keto reductase [Gemmataceae bacterium]
MESRTLGRTGLTVSRVCLGTMTFGAQVDEAAAAAMVDYCLERGVSFIDTANVYNAGGSETILGKVLRGRRDQVVLATKVGLKMDEEPGGSGLSAAAIRRGIEDSLRRLQTDFVDLYYLHQPDYTVPLEESLGAMDRLVQEGKVRFVGASNYASWQVCRMLWLAERNGWQPVQVVQPMYNLIARSAEAEFLPMCRDFGLAVAAYNPLAGGLLTGKHTGAAPLAGTRFDRMPTYRDRYWHSANFDAVRELSAIARTAGRSLISLALGWLLHHTAADCVILGASSLEQLKENLAAAEEGPLAAETVAACDRVWKALRGVSPPYNR